MHSLPQTGRPHTRVRRLQRLFALCLAGSLPSVLWAAELAAIPGLQSSPVNLEYENCAKRLFGILLYTTWQNAFATKETPLVFGIFGELPDRKLVEESLRPFIPRPIRFVTVTNGEEATRCHVLYLPNANALERRILLKAIEGKAILSIGEFRAANWPACTVEFVRPSTRNSHNRPTTLSIKITPPPANSGLCFQAPLLERAARQSMSAP